VNITGSTPDELVIKAGSITLRGVRPVLNGTILHDVPSEHIDNGFRWTTAYGAFDVTIKTANDGNTLHYALDPLPDMFLDSFGIRFDAVENVRAYLRNGYFSWDGSHYVEPEALRRAGTYDAKLTSGYAMTQLLPLSGSGSVIIGFDRHDRFQHTFTFDLENAAPSLTIETMWDQKGHAGTAPCTSERLLIFSHDAVEDALREWARRVASASPTPPRQSVPRITGWCSWYNLYAYINEENILEHLHGAARVAQREELPMQVFQLDDGFTPEMGDWLEVKPQFPRGMKPLLDDIRMAGFMPGLWIAPFMVGNRSRLYRDHPDWVVKDRLTGGPLAHMKFYAEFRWHKRSEEYYILDVTHPDAFAYLREVFRTWRHDWGCEYFKTDFMHFGSEYGPDRAQWHTPGMTRIEIWRKAASMIREEIGDAWWLGCGCPLWASVGLVDGVRIGRDIGVEWAGTYSAESLLRDQASRNFANGILWLADPDCILLRDQFHNLTDTEVRSLALYAGLAGSVIMTSDALDELPPERIALWKFILELPARQAHFPLLGQSRLVAESSPDGACRIRTLDPVLVLTRLILDNSDSPVTALLIFNTSGNPVQRTLGLSELGFDQSMCIFDARQGIDYGGPMDSISVSLPPHGSILLLVSDTPLAVGTLPAGIRQSITPVSLSGAV
jgi:alpha-galactosidase